MMKKLSTLRARCQCSCIHATYQPRALQRYAGRVKKSPPPVYPNSGLPQAARGAAGVRGALPARPKVVSLREP